MNIRLGAEKPGMMSHTKVVLRALVGGRKKTWIGPGANRAGKRNSGYQSERPMAFQRNASDIWR
jgi:hypothetical protein